jgi:hypothetical protein
MATKPATQPTLYALGTIDHDGKRYAAGDALPAMGETERDALVAAGVISTVRPAADDEPQEVAA